MALEEPVSRNCIAIYTNYELVPTEKAMPAQPKHSSDLEDFLTSLDFENTGNLPNLGVSLSNVYKSDDITLLHAFKENELTYMGRKGTIEHNCFIAFGNDVKKLNDTLLEINDFYTKLNYKMMGITNF